MNPFLRPAAPRLAHPRLAVIGATAALSALGAATVLVATPQPASGATSGSPKITDRESVQVELAPDGTVQTKRLFSQLSVDGHGPVTFDDPVGGGSLRNLDGFAAPTVTDGKAQYSLTADGHTEYRTLSEFTKKLPITVKVTYRLDGNKIDPKDLAGRSGKLDVEYTVTNTTATPTKIHYTDGHGAPVSKTVDLVTPYVGQLSTTLPASFSKIDAPRADAAGDGRGGTQLNWTMVLFSPIGEPTQTFGWSAQLDGGTLPAATVQVVPVPPQRKPELAGGMESYKEGALQATQLTGGASLINDNLLKLRDGASQLLTGLDQLHTGAAQLQDGLAGQAAPGAAALADGASKAADGGRQLNSGLGQLLAGGQQLSTGLSSADAGSQDLSTGLEALLTGGVQLTDGISAAHTGSTSLAGGLSQLLAGSTKLTEGLSSTTGQPDLLGGSKQLASGAGALDVGAATLNLGLQNLSSGLDKLAAGVGAASSDPGIAKLHAGVAQLIAGIGAPATPGTLLNGLAQLDGGLDKLQTDLGTGLTTAVTTLAGTLQPGVAGLGAAASSVPSLAGAIGVLCTDPVNPSADCIAVKTAAGTLNAVATNAPTLAAGIGQVAAGLTDGATAATAGVQQLHGGIALVRAGLDSTDPAHPGVKQGLQQVNAGIDQLVSGLTGAVLTALGSPTDGATASLRGGAAALVAGAGQLNDGAIALAGGAGQLQGGLTDATAGAQQLTGGLNSAKSGADQLDGGLGQLDAGAGALKTGAGAAAAGAKDLSSGLDQLNTGGKALLAGLGDASTGSGSLVDGLNQISSGAADLSSGLGSAADGSGQLVDGLAKAQAGDQQLVDGAGQLSTMGTGPLVEAGNTTATDNGEKYAMLQALNAKAVDGALPYGAPAGATGTAAYNYTLAAADSGDGGGDATKGGIALALFALAGLGGTILHRRLG